MWPNQERKQQIQYISQDMRPMEVKGRAGEDEYDRVIEVGVAVT